MKSVFRGRFSSAIVGLLFGPIGIGIFFRSWKDLFYLGVLYLGVIYLFSGYGRIDVPVLLASLVCAVWGAVRPV